MGIHRRTQHLIPALSLLFILSASGVCAVGNTQIVVVPVTNMYSGPSDDTDVVSQAIYGSNVTLLTAHKPVLTIPFESRLEVSVAASDDEKSGDKGKAVHEGWLQVRLPDKRSAWIQASDVVSDPKPLSTPESIELAKHFLGIPYLWGGSSSFGFDCSGFTQMLVRARGIIMPRDADKQAAWSGVVPVERKDLQPGDLLFFGASASKIDHTGMYIGDGQFIQDTTNGHPVVQISRLDDEPWTHLLVASRRVK